MLLLTALCCANPAARTLLASPASLLLPKNLGGVKPPVVDPQHLNTVHERPNQQFLPLFRGRIPASPLAARDRSSPAAHSHSFDDEHGLQSRRPGIQRQRRPARSRDGHPPRAHNTARTVAYGQARTLCASPFPFPLLVQQFHKLTRPFYGALDLKRELVSEQVKWEIAELNSPTALRRFGAPFRSEYGEVSPLDSELPILRYIFVHHIREFPFLDKAREKEFWQDRLQVVGRRESHNPLPPTTWGNRWDWTDVSVRPSSSSSPLPAKTFPRRRTGWRRPSGGSWPSRRKSSWS